MIQYASSRLEVEHRLDLLCIVPVGTRYLRTLARKSYVEVCCSDSSHDVNASAAAAATQCFTPTDRDVDRGRTSRSESCSMSSGKAICIYGAEEKSFLAIAYDDRPSTECLGCLSARRVPATLFSSHRKLLNAADRLPSHLPRWLRVSLTAHVTWLTAEAAKKTRYFTTNSRMRYFLQQLLHEPVFFGKSNVSIRRTWTWGSYMFSGVHGCWELQIFLLEMITLWKL